MRLDLMHAVAIGKMTAEEAAKAEKETPKAEAKAEANDKTAKKE